MTGILRSTISCRANMSGTLSQVRARLSAFPALKLISRGTTLIYKIDEDYKGDWSSTLELGDKEIRLSYFYPKPSEQLAAVNTARFICILGILEEIYQPEFGSIYRTIAYTLTTTADFYNGTNSASELSFLPIKERLRVLGDIVFSLASRNLKIVKDVEVKASELRTLDEALDLISRKMVGEKWTSQKFGSWLGGIGGSQSMVDRLLKIKVLR